MSWKVELSNGIHLPEIDWHLDARKPAAKAFVSHAHFDHLAKHDAILCSKRSAQLIQARMPGKRQWRVYDFEEPFELEPGVQAMLYPAGHIPGSSMLWLEKEGKSFLYTGDFKLTPGLVAEPCATPAADVLVMETTFGLPRFTFPPASEVVQDIKRFCKETLENGDTPVLFGYSLGKSQEILKALSGIDSPLLLHPQVHEMTCCCEQLGIRFPFFQAFSPELVPGSIVIAPPMPMDSEWLAQIPNRKTALVSGWAMDPATPHRSPCDKAFPLSDHADFLDLQDFARKVAPEVVYTTHGFATEFAQILNEQGIAAWALGEENQIDLGLKTERPQAPPARPSPSPAPTAKDGPSAFIHFATVWEALAKTDSRRRQVEIAVQYLSTLEATDIASAALFLSGRPFPRSSSRRLYVDSSLTKQAVLYATGRTEADYKQTVQSLGSREAALVSFLQNSRSSHRSLRDLQSLFRNLEQAPNPVFQHSILAEEYGRLSRIEGKCLMRLLAVNESGGLDESLIEEALSRRFETPLEAVQQANLRCSDLERVANATIDQLLDYVPIKLFHPLKLAWPKRLASATELSDKLSFPAWAEDRYDGMRCQIHKVGERIELYDKNGSRITHKFPEILESAVLIPQDFIADSTLVAWDKEAPLPYSKLKQRFQRPAEDLFIGEEVDTLLWLHDLLWSNGESLLECPFHQRKQSLNTFSVTPRLRIAPSASIDAASELPLLVQDARERGHKGVIVKNETSPYNPLSPEPVWFCLQ